MPLQAISALAAQTIRYAFSELERTITPGDARNFRSTTLEQVKSDVLKLENELAARQSLRNMQRLAPLFQGLEHYAKGYSRIAECLGRFSVLSSSFKGNQDFQQTFAVFYADILEFHKNSYKFVRRRSWKLFFLTSWHRFQRRFDDIFENLKRHEALIDKEANAYNIAEAQQMRREIRAWREESDLKFQQNEKEQSFRQFESIVSWLKIDESNQLNVFHTLLEETIRYPGTCDWVLRNKKMTSMLQAKPDVPLLWVQGAAGTGKSVLASSIVNFANNAGSLVLSHFCNYAYPSSIKYEWMLKSLLLQLVRKDMELAAHVFKNYVESKKAPSLPVLEALLRFLLSSISKELRKTSYVWIVIDGIDECEPLVQNKVFSLISQVASSASNSDEVFRKAMIFCRASSSASAKLRKGQSISLKEEQHHVNMSIRRYAAQRIRSLYNKFEQMSLTMDDIKDIEDAITEKADGMFLYARLVLEYLSSNIFFTGEEIKSSVYELPAKLSEFKITTQILVRLDSRSVDRVKCALGWIAFSQRPLKKMELLSAIAFSTGDTSVKHAAPQFMLDICAPLIEEKPDMKLGFIHVSVKEALNAHINKHHKPTPKRRLTRNLNGNEPFSPYEDPTSSTTASIVTATDTLAASKSRTTAHVHNTATWVQNEPAPMLGIPKPVVDLMAGTSPSVGARADRSKQMEAQLLSNFFCCDERLEDMHELLRHYETHHADGPLQRTDVPTGHRLTVSKPSISNGSGRQPSGLDSVSQSSGFFYSDETDAIGDMEMDGTIDPLELEDPSQRTM
ncbi:hypothetical protein E8E14_010905 [Neopestalotiopsis sp. 37M]|nr:hypothetical protein E8E14_010905 [Neopestalotiopsis sp. 37M]